MLAGSRHHEYGRTRRRGIVLVLVLAMLGLLALIGVTFATLASQARINARNFAQSVIQPQDDELMDFALQQLITDTADVRSVIRGHSLARDMFGNDAYNNGYLTALPTGGPIVFSAPPWTATTTAGVYTVQTNIPAHSPGTYGYNFTRWIVRLSYVGPLGPNPLPNPTPLFYPRAVTQTFEIVSDTTYSNNSGIFHAFNLVAVDPAGVMNAIAPVTTASTNPNTGLPYPYPMPNAQTVLNNPSLGATTPPTDANGNAQNSFPGWNSPNQTNQLGLAYMPGQLALQQYNSPYLTQNNGNYSNWGNYSITLDGRWLHAFNGPGLTNQSTSVSLNYTYNGNAINLQLGVPNSTYGNFRFNGLNPNTVGMDEDYDACDLENWFLAIQSADGQVMIPSFHRPGVVRYESAVNPFDWDRSANGFRASNYADSASRILRPVAADGHDPVTFPDLVPDTVSGKITYDVDNDGDGISDSVWLDLGYPARRDARGNLYKPLFAFMVIGLNGRIPLNTAGNLAGNGASHAQHLGNSVSEIDPTYGLQNAFNLYSSVNPNGDQDPFNQLGSIANGIVFNGPTGTYPTYNSQVDNALNGNPSSQNAGQYQSVDVRLTQLRNLLSGTRPQTNPFSPSTAVNGEIDLVWGSWPGQSAGTAYTLPNGIANYNDVSSASSSVTVSGTSYNFPLVQRLTPPVAGRWGEATSVAGVPFPNPSGNGPLNMVQVSYANPPRAGYSFDTTDLLNSLGTNGYDANGDPIFPRDAADDNYNAFDVFPTRLTGEIGDSDFYDAAGGLLLPVERMRRFVTPLDINGTGRVNTWGQNNAAGTRSDYGPDPFGRVQFASYFRPAGVAGPINITTPFPTNSVPSPATGAEYPYGAITAGPYNTNTNPYSGIYGSWSNGELTPWSAGTTYIPDVTNNQLHGYELYKLPNQYQNPGGNFSTSAPSPAAIGGMPIDQDQLSSTVEGGSINIPSTFNPPAFPAAFPTYDNKVNSSQRLDGVNEADEMNLYTFNPLLDSPYGPSDLEWLYRQQDVDGATLTSRLSQLAPVSFTNTIDGLRRRRLYALHSWELTNFAWAPDNPGGAFANNARFGATANASYANLSLATPTLAHRDKKINLNFPLPVSNDCNEPIRQRWIYDTYQLLKSVLPPTAVDSAEELAQLSQFVINIVDFRDPDATMTHFVNPDIVLTPGSAVSVSSSTTTNGTTTTTTSTYYTNPNLTISVGAGNLDQFGMEYNPVAINEVLAYGFQSRSGTQTSSAIYTNRIFVELVNTLTAAYNPSYDYGTTTTPNPNMENYYGYGSNNANGNSYNASTPPFQNQYATAPPMQASTLDLGGFSYTQNDPYQGGCWDLVFTLDNAMARPDPYRGDLVNNYNANAAALGVQYTTFALVPLNRDSVTNTNNGVGWSPPSGEPTAASTTTQATVPPNGGDVTLIPLSPGATTPVSTSVTGYNNGTPPFNLPGSQPSGIPPINYFYVVGSPYYSSTTTTNGQSTTTTYESTPISNTSNGNAVAPCMTQYFSTNFDPMGTTTVGSAGPPGFQWHPGILPGVQQSGAAGASTYSAPLNYWWDLPTFGTSSSSSSSSGGGGGVGSQPSTTPQALTPGTATYYWVCLRRPANPFAPVSATNPMVVVDSMRFPYIDGTANAGVAWSQVSPTNPLVTPGANANANTIFSAQRLQPYRGGHAVPMPNAVPTNTSALTAVSQMPPDPRYGYSEQTAVPATFARGGNNYGLANTTSNAYASTNYMYHTLGYNNDSAENWDYFVFNDRDFSSVAELLLVPGCPPGLFTKQFAEFAPGQLIAANIFSAVTPVITPQYRSTLVNISQGGAVNTTSNASLLPSPFSTATVPFLDAWQAIGTPTALTLSVPSISNSSNGQNQAGPGANNGLSSPYNQPAFNQSGSNNTAVQPHAFPYLVDKFFYTGASTFYYPPTGGQMDPGSGNSSGIPVVGGPGGDGWFKMLEFFEVPSQAMGAYGPIAGGNNFDWARQDIKPGLMNLNLVIDEEAFYGIFGRQSTAGGFNQSLLNSTQLPLLATYHANNGQLTPPYTMPLSGYKGGAPPIAMNGPPVPLVVSAIQPTGAPNFVYPITDQTQLIEHGYLATDPIASALYTAAQVSPYVAVGNRIKASFAQFLWARHGGSGYVFGYGNGSTGQNSAVVTQAGQVNAGAIPIERPFHSLSFPDINFTIMRPAALPPSTVSNPAMVASNANNNPPPVSVFNAQMMNTSLTPMAATSTGTAQPFYSPSGIGSLVSSGSFYAPFLSNTINNYPETLNFIGPIVYTGDPGVRNPYLNQGYVSGSTTSPTNPTNPGTAPYTVFNPSTPILQSTTVNGVTSSSYTNYNLPAGVPLPTNVAFPTGSTSGQNVTNTYYTDSVMLPPPIPPLRLFQIPDAYGAGLFQRLKYMGVYVDSGTVYGNLPPTVSNASTAGDPWINNTIANQLMNPWVSDALTAPQANMNNYPSSYTLNGSFGGLTWGGGRFFYAGDTNYPYLTATGVLPPASISYPPYSPPYLSLTLQNNPSNLTLANGYSGGTTATTPDLGGYTAGSNPDLRQHPYWRTELLQKAMNLTTVRTHQYAVWLTVGFFEVLRQGDVSMLAQGAPQLAFDIMGPEIGALNGQNVRYRGFFVVDRLQLTGFNSGNSGGFRAAVIYRKKIQ